MNRYGICFPCGVALSEVLRGIREGQLRHFDFGRRLRWVRTIAAAVARLHSGDVTHGDLKPHNIILRMPTAQGREEIYMTGFGSAKVMESQKPAERAVSPMETLQYTAPEVLRHAPRQYSSVDVYALSVLSWEILSVATPFGGMAAPALREVVCSGARPSIPMDWEPAVRTAIERGWDANAAKRGTVHDFLATMFGPSAASADDSDVGQSAASVAGEKR